MVTRALLCTLVWASLSLAPVCGPRADRCRPETLPIAVDIGHTPKHGGATSARGRPEYAFNRRLAGELVAGLHDAGFAAAFLINPHGAEIKLGKRSAIAAARGAKLLLSIHHDSVQPRYLETWQFDGRSLRFSDRFQGHSLFVSRKGADLTGSRRLASLIGRALLDEGLRATLHHAEPIRGENRPLLDERLGIYAFDDLVVLETATMPAVLIEAGVILNRREEALLDTPEYRGRIISAILTALLNWCEGPADR